MRAASFGVTMAIFIPAVALSGSAVKADSMQVNQISPSSGSVSGGSYVEITGSGLDTVSRVEFDGVSAQIVTVSPTIVGVITPGSTDYAVKTVDVSVEGASVSRNPGRFDYQLGTGVDRQLNYALTWWNKRNPFYLAFKDTDCMNFASQTLLARGWKMDEVSTDSDVREHGWFIQPDENHEQSTDQFPWITSEPWVGATAYYQWLGYARHGENDSEEWPWLVGRPWISCTRFYLWLKNHPELATELDDETERQRVKVGDIVQFDWGDPDDFIPGFTVNRDHAGIVTRVDHQPDGATKVYFADHTYGEHSINDAYRDVDVALAERGPNPTAHYWSILTP